MKRRNSAANNKKNNKGRKVLIEPEKPLSAFFYFVEGFRKRKEYKDKRSISVECLKEWNTLTEAEKAPYIKVAETKNAEYLVQLKNYKREHGGSGDEEEDDHSEGRVGEEEEGGSGDEEEDDHSEGRVGEEEEGGSEDEEEDDHSEGRVREEEEEGGSGDEEEDDHSEGGGR